jgi:hypothetical protein
MGLSIPTVGVDPGPDWANNVNADLTTIDGHNHTPGHGVQIPVSGLSIQVDFPLNNNYLTTVKAVRFTSQSTPLATPGVDQTEIYVLNGDLWYINAVGTPVRITNGSSIAGATGNITGLPNGFAGVNYNSVTLSYDFTDQNNNPASLAVGPSILLDNPAASYGVTLAAPASNPTPFTVILPIAPAHYSNFMLLSSTGQISTIDASGGIQPSMIAPNSLGDAQITPQGISAASILNNTITRTQEAAVGQQISASSGLYSTTSTAAHQVPNLFVVMGQTYGRPISIALQSDRSPNPATVVGIPDGTLYLSADYGLGTAAIAEYRMLEGNTGGIFLLLDPAPATAPGVITYTVQIRAISGSCAVGFMTLVAYEL